nr:MAG TPA: hypothetical protein [Myoviridae sp. ctPCN11]DAY08971.1 MAG TPA: hypothetical protein [Caudoviricetes sp.]
MEERAGRCGECGVEGKVAIKGWARKRPFFLSW